MWLNSKYHQPKQACLMVSGDRNFSAVTSVGTHFLPLSPLLQMLHICSPFSPSSVNYIIFLIHSNQMYTFPNLALCLHCQNHPPFQQLSFSSQVIFSPRLWKYYLSESKWLGIVNGESFGTQALLVGFSLVGPCEKMTLDKMVPHFDPARLILTETKQSNLQCHSKVEAPTSPFVLDNISVFFCLEREELGLGYQNLSCVE